MKKAFCLGLFVLFISIRPLFSQDIILLRSGEEIRAKIIEVTSTQVKYKRLDNQEGPNYITLKSEIFMITYENGRKEVFDQQSRTSQLNPNIQQGVVDDSLWLKEVFDQQSRTRQLMMDYILALDAGQEESASDDYNTCLT